MRLVLAETYFLTNVPYGDYGYMREYLVERLYRDNHILSIGGGTQEIMKEIISKHL